jgi:diguanylate cyclase
VSVDVKLQQTTTWATHALERIKRYGLNPTPNNFALFYYYSAGTNPNLKMAIDLLLSQQETLNQQICDELYQAHLGLDAEQKALKDANAAIEAEVTRVLDAIDRAASNTTQYNQTLDKFSGQLTSTASLEEIRGAVTKVVSETRSMVKQNERLSTQLASTTQQLTELRYNFDQAHKELQVDPLTEVGNRKFFDNELEHSTSEARDNGSPLSLLMIDIDHFKKFNDTYGHVIGDQVLRLVARTLVENLKGRDVIARYGGEEFVILLPQTKVHDAAKVANLLRDSLSKKSIRKRSTNETLGGVTISIGAAEFCIGESLESFVSRADSGLYKAKSEGRNRVVTTELAPEEMAELRSKTSLIGLKGGDSSIETSG